MMNIVPVSYQCTQLSTFPGETSTINYQTFRVNYDEVYLQEGILFLLIHIFIFDFHTGIQCIWSNPSSFLLSNSCHIFQPLFPLKNMYHLSFIEPLSPLSAAGICRSVEPFTGTWAIYQVLYLRGKLTRPLLVAIH